MERINVIFRLRPKMRLKNSQLKVEEVLRIDNELIMTFHNSYIPQIHKGR